MAESASQRKLRKLREQRRAAMSRSEGGSREDEAVDKTVNPPTPTTTATVVEGEYKDVTNKKVTKPNSGRVSARRPIRLDTRGQARLYQKHVLFAIISAFLIKMVSSGKLSPK